MKTSKGGYGFTLCSTELKMLRFLREGISNRKARRAERRTKSNDQEKEEETSSSAALETQDVLDNVHLRDIGGLDRFVDDMSDETSLYTSPSKYTVQYPNRRTHTSGNIEWYSSQGSEAIGSRTLFTAEQAMIQYRLGGWQSNTNMEYSTDSVETSSFSASLMPRSSMERNDVVHPSFTESVTLTKDVSSSSSDQTGIDLKESSSDDCSDASSEISWNLDRRAFYDRINSIEANEHKSMMSLTRDSSNVIDDGEDEGKQPDRDKPNYGDGEEDSACSTVSSLTMCNFVRDDFKSKKSSLSARTLTHSLPNETTSHFRNDPICVINETQQEASINANKLRSTDVSKRNDSCDQDDLTTPTNQYSDETVSFSGVISKCETESLTRRLTPGAIPQPTESVDRMSEEISPDALPNPDSLDEQQTTTGDSFTSTQEDRKIVTPKVNNTSSNLSGCNCMMPEISNNSSSPTKGHSDEPIDFSDMVYKFETQSSTHNMDPPDPRRLVGQTLHRNCTEKNMKLSDDKLDLLAEGKILNRNPLFESRDQIVDTATTVCSCSSSTTSAHTPSVALGGPADNEVSESCPSTTQQTETKVNIEHDPALLPSHRCQLRAIKSQVENQDFEVGERLYEKEHSPNVVSTYNDECPTSEVDSGNEINSECKDGFRNYECFSPGNEEAPTTASIQQSERSVEGVESESFDLKDAKNVALDFQRAYDGPVDLDEMSTSELSSSKEESSIIEKEDERPLSVWGDAKEEEDMDMVQSESGRNGIHDSIDETLIEQSYNQTLKAISTSEHHQVPPNDRSPSFLSLNESELARHLKLMETIETPTPTSAIPGYDEWKREQETDRLYFQKLEEQVSRHKNIWREPEPTSRIPEHPVSHSRDASGLADAESSNKTGRVSIEEEKPTTNHRKQRMQIWRLLGGILQRAISKKEKKIEEKNKTTIDNDCNDSSRKILNEKLSVSKTGERVDSDLCGLSLLPLSQLGHLTNRTGHGSARQQMVLEHLEMERKKQIEAEADKEKNEWLEQLRISFMKEQELERQRRLNCSKIGGAMHKLQMASPGFGLPRNPSSSDCQRTRLHSGFKSGNVLDPCKVHHQGYLYSTTPIHYLCDRSGATNSTARESESLESRSVDSFLHSKLSFDSAQSAPSFATLKSVSYLSPCALCKVSERSHISMPCMHFSFCSECAEELHGHAIPTCPVCQTEDIVLRRVNM